MLSLSAYCKKIQICSISILSLLGCTVFFPAISQQPFRFDNVLYKAVYWNDAVRLMNENSDYLLLDVRSPGEYADTSQYKHLNMGHLKGAKNINIDSFEDHLNELTPYKGKNIFVYCSHSQRSRHISKLLADNGFKNVYNINGGMSVANESGTREFPLKNTVFVSNNSYTNIASSDALDMIEKKGVVIFDVRSRNAYNSKDNEFANNLGYIKNAVNIPADEAKEKFKTLNIPKDKMILVYDLRGSSSIEVASEIAKMGFTQVFNLFGGLAGFMTDNHLEPAIINKVILNPPPFHVVGVKECINLLSKPNNFTVIDARPKEEFENKSSKEYLNNGRIINAINVPSVNALAPIIKSKNKTADILVYGSFSGNNDVDICKTLIEQGYKNVYFLYQGIGQLAWSCFNIENCKDGLSILTDHKGLY